MLDSISASAEIDRTTEIRSSWLKLLSLIAEATSESTNDAKSVKGRDSVSDAGLILDEVWRIRIAMEISRSEPIDNTM